MRLGFYYHIPLNSSPDGLNVPSYLGVFLDALASEVEKLLLFMHEANDIEANHCDYLLKSSNIDYFTLGFKTPAWDRFLWPGKALRKIRAKVSECDVLLVRAPSPLAPAFFQHFNKLTRVAYLVVGDYIDGSRHLDQPWYRKLPIIVLSAINDRQLSAVLTRSRTLVNSQKLHDKYKQYVRDLHLVRTTTLSQKDFYYREDTCQGNEIKLLYTGSFSFAKGLRELVDAFAILTVSKENITLHFVGWDYNHAKPIETYLRKQAEMLNVAEKVFFHGFKTVGPELNEMYRLADIYIIPSYHEGFPRTIWEAMANSLPVIASRVGSIPYFLKDRGNAFLIEPKRTDEIILALREIILNSDLRKKMIKNGFRLAKENTIDIQTKHLVNILAKTEK